MAKGSKLSLKKIHQDCCAISDKKSANAKREFPDSCCYEFRKATLICRSFSFFAVSAEQIDAIFNLRLMNHDTRTIRHLNNQKPSPYVTSL